MKVQVVNGTVGMSAMTLAEAHAGGYALVVTHTNRFVDYVRHLTPDELERPVPGLDWTVGQTVTHVRSVYERYTLDSRRAATADEVTAFNEEDIERLGGDAAADVRSIEAQLATLATVVDHIAPERVFPFHAGQVITIAGGWGNLLGELHAHGDDLARGTGSPFGVPGEDLEILWRFTMPALQGWLSPQAADVAESWCLRLPFGDILLVLDHGIIRTGPDEAALSVHHELEIADVAGFTLAFPYRRRPLPDPTAQLLASRFRDI